LGLCCAAAAAAAAQVFYRERAARMYDPLALGIGKDKAGTHISLTGVAACAAFTGPAY
jgi:hypothetical protein